MLAIKLDIRYQVGDVVIYRPKGEPNCYSPVARPWARWPSPFWRSDVGMARSGDLLMIVKIDEVAGEQRLWYESPYATYGPAPEYATPDPGKPGCHNVLASDVRPSWRTVFRCALWPPKQESQP